MDNNRVKPPADAQAPPVRLEHPLPHIALVTLNRPASRNAIDPATAHALGAIVAQTEVDPDVRVVVLTGTGTVFCAGADLRSVSAGDGPALYTADGGFAGFVDAPRSKPWIAAVNGPALAGGTEIALACDLIVAAETATFGLPEVRRGLIAAAGGLYRLPRALPAAIAAEAILTGEPFSAATALHHGMVNRLVPAGHVGASACALAASIARNAPLAVRESLAMVRSVPGRDDPALHALSQQARDRIRQSEDFREGPRAFVEKREPRWTGR